MNEWILYKIIRAWPLALPSYFTFKRLESETGNLALDNCAGTLIFVSHDREFVSSLATRVVELTPQGVTNYVGTYDEYLLSQGVEIGVSSAQRQAW